MRETWGRLIRGRCRPAKEDSLLENTHSGCSLHQTLIQFGTQTPRRQKEDCDKFALDYYKRLWLVYYMSCPS